MSWLEQVVRRYEHRRWAAEPNRRALPFAWGLEHIGGRRDESDPRGFLREWAAATLARSGEWFAVTPAPDYRLDDGVLSFTSAVESPWPENNTVYARFFPARKSGPCSSLPLSGVCPFTAARCASQSVMFAPIAERSFAYASRPSKIVS